MWLLLIWPYNNTFIFLQKGVDILIQSMLLAHGITRTCNSSNFIISIFFLLNIATTNERGAKCQRIKNVNRVMLLQVTLVTFRISTIYLNTRFTCCYWYKVVNSIFNYYLHKVNLKLKELLTYNDIRHLKYLFLDTLIAIKRNFRISTKCICTWNLFLLFSLPKQLMGSRCRASLITYH